MAQQPNNKVSKKSASLSAYARYSGIAIQMFAIIGLGTFAGVKLDEHFNKDNKVFTIIFSLSSVILAVFYVIRSIIAASKDNRDL